MSEAASKLYVYYDNSCPICREEINALKSVDHQNALELIDCSSPDFNDASAAKAGYTQETLINAMHVRSANERWYVAADAFVVMYETVGFDAAARLLKRQKVRSVFEWAYPFFVKHRHKFRFLGIHRIMPWLIRRAAAKQSAKAQSCAIDRSTNKN